MDCIFIYFSSFFVLVCFYFFFTQARYCQEQGIDANQSFVMYLFNGVASVLLRALTGHICDIKRLDPRWVLQIAMFLAGIISVLMTHFHSYNELFACFVLYGVMDGTIVSSVNILALYTLSPEERPQGFGFFHLCIAISLAAGPPFGGMYDLNARRGGGGGVGRERESYQQSFVLRGSAQMFNPLPFYTPFLAEKSTPFVYLPFKTGTPSPLPPPPSPLHKPTYK